MQYPDDFIVQEDMVCPVNKTKCDDECCTVGSVCNCAHTYETVYEIMTKPD